MVNLKNTETLKKNYEIKKVMKERLDEVYKNVLDTLKNMVTSEDMLPLLESLRVKYKWITPIINKLNSDNTLYCLKHHR